MSLQDQVNKDLVAAMKAKEADKVSTLRMLKTAMNNAAIAKQKNDLKDDEALDVIQKQAKQRKDSIESFEKAGRQEMADKEKSELAILQTYLPAQLSEEEIKKFAQEAIQKTGAASKADMGKVMGALMPNVKGKADGKTVNKVVMSLLG